jgi:hypothetical protein
MPSVSVIFSLLNAYFAIVSGAPSSPWNPSWWSLYSQYAPSTLSDLESGATLARLAQGGSANLNVWRLTHGLANKCQPGNTAVRQEL